MWGTFPGSVLFIAPLIVRNNHNTHEDLTNIQNYKTKINLWIRNPLCLSGLSSDFYNILYTYTQYSSPTYIITIILGLNSFDSMNTIVVLERCKGRFLWTYISKYITPRCVRQNVVGIQTNRALTTQAMSTRLSWNSIRTHLSRLITHFCRCIYIFFCSWELSQNKPIP